MTPLAAWAHSTVPVATWVCADAAPPTAPQVKRGTGLLPATLEHRFSLAPAGGIAKETCRGLKVTHPRGIFPRDLQPATVRAYCHR